MLSNPEMLSLKFSIGHNNSIINCIGRICFMKGGESDKWSDIDMLDHFLRKAQNSVKKKAEE